MGMRLKHDPKEDRLSLIIEDNLDLTLTGKILEACEYVNENLALCVIDCTRVCKVFDSGIAVMRLLMRKIEQYRVKLVILGEIEGMHQFHFPGTEGVGLGSI